MIRTDIVSRNPTIEDQETANASSGLEYTSVVATNAATTITTTKTTKTTTICETPTEQRSTVGNKIVKDISSSSSSSCSSSQQSGESFLSQKSTGKNQSEAPVIGQDVSRLRAKTITPDKEPHVMVPCSEGQTLLAVDLSQAKETIQMDSSRNEQQARDILCWNDGIGTLEGCDLRFKINQLGCLELLDSDDESENASTLIRQNAISKNLHQNSSGNLNGKKQANINNSTKPIARTKTSIPNDAPPKNNFITTPTNGTSDAYSNKNDGINNNNNNNNNNTNKKPKLETGAKQISPGSSLLRDGPNMRRPKSSSSNYNSTPNCIRTSANNTLAIQRKIEQYQNTILLEKLVPKQKLEEIKSSIVENWSVEDVRNFVDSIPGCVGFGESFESQQICGKSLLYLDQKDLLEVINIKLGPAVKIYHAISLLK